MILLCNQHLEHVSVRQTDTLPRSECPRCTFAEYSERQDRQNLTIHSGQSNGGCYAEIIALSPDEIVRSLLARRILIVS